MMPIRNGNTQQAGDKKKQPQWLPKLGIRNYLNPDAPDQADETC
jgi:hypothetical protein